MNKAITILASLILSAHALAQTDNEGEATLNSLLAKSDSLFALGVDLYNKAEYQEAIPIFMESDQIDKAVHDPTSTRRDYSAMWLAACHCQLGDTAKAQATYGYWRFAPVDRRLTVKSDSLSEAGVLHWNNGFTSNDMGELESALECFLQCAEIEKTVVGEEHISCLNTLIVIGLLYNDLAYFNYLVGNNSEAIRLGTEAVNTRGRVLGKEHPDYLTSLNNLATAYIAQGNYSEAIRLDTEAVNTRERVLGKEHPDYLTSLNNLAAAYNAQGNYSEAIRLGTEVLNIRERVLGKEHPDYATSLGNLASDFANLGDYSEAIRLTTEAMGIQERVLGKESLAYAMSLGNLAVDHANLGDYYEAIMIGTEALEIGESVVGKEHPMYATVLNNIACSQGALGNYPEAIKLGTEALDIQERVVGKEHPDYATTLGNLAYYNSRTGNYSAAIRLDTEALNIWEKAVGKEHPYYATPLNNLAVVNTYMGDYSEAIRLGTEALNIREKAVGKEHPDYATSLDNLAGYNDGIGNYSEAIRLGTEALNIRERVLGKEHPDYATSNSNLAGYGFNNGDRALVNGYTVQASELLSSIVKRTFADLTSTQRLLFWGKYSNWYEQVIHRYAFCMPSDTLARNGYNGVLLSKGLLLNSDIEFSRLIQESGDSETVAMYADLRSLRLQINKLLETPVAERFADVDSLERLAQAKEQALIARSKVYGDYTDNLVITWEQVRDKLASGDMAVEFVSFTLNADSTMYVAYVLKKDWDSPRLIPLFEESQLSQVHPDEQYTTADVSRLVWQPIEEVLKGVKTVYFAPSGELYNIAVESVPDHATGGRTTVSDGRTYCRLSSTRELALRKDKDAWDVAAVYGGLEYGMTAEGLTANSRDFNPHAGGGTTHTNEIYSIADTLSAMRGGALAEQLPGTLVEAEAIDTNLEALGVASTLYTDTIGTEASFKSLDGKRTSIMHIGTHGFYWTEKEARNLGYKFLLNSESARGSYVEDKQLSRSGLLFAGANYVLSGNGEDLPESVDDGILTAKELTGIDLRGLDLVVLSACQTGLGEITGDGVFGLQRGFKKAGAQTIVMSLWKVDDEATRLFMVKFFEGIRLDKQGRPTNKHEAFLAAQHYLRNEYEIEQTRTLNDNLTPSQRRRLEREGTTVEAQTVTERVKPYADPKFWAAFIMLDGVD